MTKETKPQGEQTNQEETLTITRKQLQAIVQEEIQKGLRGGLKRPQRVTERTASLRFYNGKPVIGYGKVKEVWDQVLAERVAYMDIELLGEEKPVKVEYLKFLNSELPEQEAYQVLIKEQKAKEIINSEGSRVAENPDEANISSKPGSWKLREIELENISYQYTAVVEVSEGPYKGQTFTLSTECLNK